MKSLKTWASIRNEQDVLRAARDYDPLLDLNYSPKEGFYYLSRPFNNFDESEAAQFLCNDSSIFNDALQKRHLVVCYPILVKMMEAKDIAIRNVIRHLKTNDTKHLGSSRMGRIKNAETAMDNEHSTKKQVHEARCRDELKAYGREYYRDFVRTKINMSGFKFVQGGAAHGAV